MKIKLSELRKMVREEMGRLNEGMADEMLDKDTAAMNILARAKKSPDSGWANNVKADLKKVLSRHRQGVLGG